MDTHQQKLILAIDQGTTSTRALVFNAQLKVVGRGQYEFAQHFPHDGWVEHDPEDIWQTTLNACRDAIKASGASAQNIVSIGITNQRETTVVWDRTTGKAIYNAIVWQDRRTADYCQQLKDQGHEEEIQQQTGLLLDPYFSGTKLRWILDNVPGARSRAERGELCFGTIDSYLLWKLTGGQVHKTDASNASRTLLMNLTSRTWEPNLIELFAIPASMLPSITDNAGDIGITDPVLFGAEIPIHALIGDQQSALLGQGCINTGQGKSTYGTGCFMLVNSGAAPVISNNRLLSTLAWQLNGNATYALEGSIFMAGAIVQWLRDKLGIITQAAETEQLAEHVPWQQTEMLIPAFTGLGAPYWQPNARAAIFGMTRNTGKEQIAAAALRSVAYQSQDLLQAMIDDGQQIKELKVDGGMTENKWFLQALADLTQCTIVPADSSEITIRGAAFLAGLQAGIFNSINNINDYTESHTSYSGQLTEQQCQQLYQRWLAAVDKVR
ncbi:glycerol kinase GlpK [Aliidiomarina quisquiliarum]|uniref:glycerol kinase GlpK n=1 Tax=Aliidiomarina quisquiliarum TaxID=2938947 RepID=UPI00208F347B|nr:glycerol kinase GlpK [Aliidiomarina quisquiliarum]MCO4322278.1 glycerol kinase GlpK [Aliidiomarina quisquiliarum]